MNDGLVVPKEGEFLIDVGDSEDLPDRSGSPVSYVIEDLLPEYQVHLIGGPSGSGKTTLTFQLFDALTSTPSKEFLGRSTKPVKWGYISGDRAVASVKETQARLGVDFPVFSLVDHNLVGQDIVSMVFPRLTGFYGYRPDFIYIDGFTAACPGGKYNDYITVAKWLAGLQRFCWAAKVTILGACHTTKTREHEKITDPRQRITGSVAWAGYSETVILIDMVDKKPDCRDVNLLPRNRQGEVVRLRFDGDGRLVMPDHVRGRSMATRFIMEQIIGKVLVGLEVKYTDLKIAALGQNVTKRSFDRWLSEVGLGEGWLERTEKGVYRRLK